MIVGEIAVLNRLSDEWPQYKSFICGLKVKHNIERTDKFLFFNEENSPEKFFRNRERSHLHISRAGLFQNPFENVRHLEDIAQISLMGTVRER